MPIKPSQLLRMCLPLLEKYLATHNDEQVRNVAQHFLAQMDSNTNERLNTLIRNLAYTEPPKMAIRKEHIS